METIKTDILIIGSGIAGSVYAYQAAKLGLSCTLISSENELGTCNSNLAQGGIIYPEINDIQDLVTDIQKASHFTSDPKICNEFTSVGTKIISSLLVEELKVPFDKKEDGSLRLTKEAVHSKPRIAYAKDHTGETILQHLHQTIVRQNLIKILANHVAIDLLTLSHSSTNILDRYKPITTIGAYVYDIEKQTIKAITAKKTILATGGLSHIYLHSTGVASSFGSGIAMAYRIGARIMNMEYIQFHPTVFYKKHAPYFLISEAIRGEGGILINCYGTDFMSKYHKDASLAPRDIVARAIKEEMFKTNSDSVYIDLSKLSSNFIKERFPAIYNYCFKYGIDITKTPIPVVPAAHYTCGGIHAQIDGRTNVLNLNAIGEVACTGLHGANRLASASLLEGVIMGYLAAETDKKELSSQEFDFPEIKPWKCPQEEADALLIKQDLSLIQNTMWNYVGLIRTQKHLARATKILAELKIDIDNFYSNCKLSKELIQLRNAIQNAMLVTYAASMNKESEGCHYREA